MAKSFVNQWSRVRVAYFIGVMIVVGGKNRFVCLCCDLLSLMICAGNVSYVAIYIFYLTFPNGCAVYCLGLPAAMVRYGRFCGRKKPGTARLS